MQHNCDSCVVQAELARMGVSVDRFDRVVALAGNPNTGKSTLFNALTGLKQHTGNWPGKTVSRAEGGFEFNKVRYKLVDLPGTYSLLSASHDEEVARDFLLFGRPDATIVVVDATALERNLNLVIQVLEITPRVVVAVNLMDEAQRKGIDVDTRALSRDLGVPAVGIVARTGDGVHSLLEAVDGVSSGQVTTSPLHVAGTEQFQRAVAELVPLIEKAVPGLPNARWIAIRLLDGDAEVEAALTSGRLSELVSQSTEIGGAIQPEDRPRGSAVMTDATAAVAAIRRAATLRETLHVTFRDEAVRSIYSEASRVAARAVHRPDGRGFDFDQRIDRLVTSPVFGLPIMGALLALIFWLTIAGANVPSAMLANALFWVEDLGAGLFESAGPPVVDYRVCLAWRVPRARLGDQRHVAADGHFLPAVHDARGPRLSAARGVQPRLSVSPRGGTRQAGADDGDGVRLQCRRASLRRGSSTRHASAWSRF